MPDTHDEHQHSYIANNTKGDCLKRLRRIEGQAHCVVHAVAAGGEDAQIKLKEASDAIARLVRS